MIRIIRDLNEGAPVACESWRAALAECTNPVGTDRERWCVAWGECYAMLSSGVRPLGWSSGANTDEDGVRWFDSLAEAEAYLACIESASVTN